MLAVDRSPLQFEGGVKLAILAGGNIHVDAQVGRRRGERPRVTPIERKKGGHMEHLVEGPLQRASLPLRIRQRQHICMTFFPRRVGDLGDDAVQGAGLIVAVVKTDRVEAVTAVTQVREHADRPTGPRACRLLDAIAHGLGQRTRRVAEKIATLECREISPVHRPQPAIAKHVVDLVQIQVQLRHPVCERMRARCMATMAHPTFVDGAGQSAHAAASNGSGASGRRAAPWDQLTPRACATSTPLRMPSS